MHYLDKFFNPYAIAIVGASDKPYSVGGKLFSNVLEDEFKGQVFAVNPKHKLIRNQKCYSTITEIEQPLDLVIIAIPATTVPTILEQCGKRHIRAALILSAGFRETGKKGAELEQKILAIARKYQMRLLGPNCLGIIRPYIGLNATFSNNQAKTGSVALVSQSGAISVAILDWAKRQQIGFSSVISLGNTADVGFGDILNYLALDNKTESILLYIEGIRDARRFMSGLRAAAQLKPVIVLKAGRHLQGSRAAISHTGAMIGSDDVFNVALARAGAVRVFSIEQLFSATQILSSNYRTKGNRLAVITNGGGVGVMAADRAAELNLVIAELSSSTYKRLNKILPAYWSHQNPIDILGDATAERYQQVITACLEDNNIDGVLVILVPLAMTESTVVAEEIIKIAKSYQKPVLACWMGELQVKSARKLFAKAHLPYFDTPEAAVEAFSYLAEYYHNQQLLKQVPEPLNYQSKADLAEAKIIIQKALKEKRNVLSTIESKKILAAFGVPITETLDAYNEQQALDIAEKLGFPLVMKILSPDISHKQEVGGVQLNISNREAVRQNFRHIITQAKKHRPDAKILGVTLERMYKNPNDRELMIGVLRDAIFGPIISFGAGGSIVEVMQDRALALPPLNQYIAQRLIKRTRVAKLLGSFRDMPAVNLLAIENTLLCVSEMVCELPQISEMDINPLITNEKEVIAVDARIVIDPVDESSTPYSHMAVHPYPNYLLSQFKLGDSTIIDIRPIRPEDAKLVQEFVRSLSPRTKYFRYMQNLQELTIEMLIRFTQIDYDREMAFIATQKDQGTEIILGIARYVINSDQETCEFALVVTDSWQNKGIGSRLMMQLIQVARSRNLSTMIGEILANNEEMLALVRNLGFVVRNSEEDATIKIAAKVLNSK